MRSRNDSRSILARLLAFLLIFALRFEAVSQQHTAPAPVPPRTREELQERITALLDQPQFAATRWGLRIITDKGAVVYERDADKAFMPASNMKLYTSATALDAFGPDFRIKTSVFATKPIGKGGILQGDLLFYGRGDPGLSSRFDGEEGFTEFKPADRIGAVEALADQIKAAGLRRLNGDVIGDDSYFATDLLGSGWQWDYAQFYFGAEVSALTINDNVVTFTVVPAVRPGERPSITVRPQTSYVTIINHATTTARGQTRIGVDRPLNSNAVEFFGTMPRTAEKFEVNIAIHDPARFAATLLKEALARRGVRFTGQVRRFDAVTRLERPFDPGKLHEVATLASPPLSTMLKMINKPSQNLHAELMLRQLASLSGERALDDYGRPRASEASGNEARRKFLQKAGVDVQRLSLRDGSGLSRQDLVTPRATTQLLDFMRMQPYFEVFSDSLPVAGVDGTLQRRMSDTPAARNVRAKTGTLAYVSALSGYLKTATGQTLVFSLMENNYSGPGRDVTQVFDQICAILAQFDSVL